MSRKGKKRGLDYVGNNPNPTGNIDRSIDHHGSRESDNSDYTYSGETSSDSDLNLSTSKSDSDSNTTTSSSSSSDKDNDESSSDSGYKKKDKRKKKKREKERTTSTSEPPTDNPMYNSYQTEPNTDMYGNTVSMLSRNMPLMNSIPDYNQSGSNCHGTSSHSRDSNYSPAKHKEKNKKKRNYENDDSNEESNKKSKMEQSKSSSKRDRRSNKNNGGYNQQHRDVQDSSSNNTMSNGPRNNRMNNLQPSPNLDKITEHTVINFTITGTPKEMNELAKLSPNKKVELNLLNACAQLESTSSNTMISRFNKNKYPSTSFVSTETTQTPSKSSLARGMNLQSTPEKQNDGNSNSSLDDKDIVRSVTLVKGEHTFPHTVEYYLPNIVVPGHHSMGHAKHSNISDSVNVLGDKDDNSLGSSKNGLSFTMEPNERISHPRELASSNINGDVIQYLTKFSGYTSKSSLEKNVTPDVNGKVKILHTNEKPHPVVRFYTELENKKKEISDASSTKQYQQQNQTSSKSKKGNEKYSSKSKTNNMDAARDMNGSAIQHQIPGLSQSRDHPEYVIMDKIAYKSTVDYMAKHPSVTDKLDSLSDVSKPVALLTPKINHGNAKSLIEQAQAQRSKQLESITNKDNIEKNNRYDNNTDSASKKTPKTTSPPMKFTSFSNYGTDDQNTPSESKTQQKQFGESTDGTKGQTEFTWIGNTRSDSEKHDVPYKANFSLLIRSIPAKKLQQIKPNT